MKLIFLSFYTVIINFSLMDQIFAQNPNSNKTKTPEQKVGTLNVDCKYAINIRIDSSTCDSCSKAIEKTFSQKEDIEAVEVDLENGDIFLGTTNNAKISNATLTEIIKSFGYNIIDIQRGC